MHAFPLTVIFLEALIREAAVGLPVKWHAQQSDPFIFPRPRIPSSNISPRPKPSRCSLAVDMVITVPLIGFDILCSKFPRHQ